MFPRYQSEVGTVQEKPQRNLLLQIRKQTSLLQRFGRRVHRNHAYNGNEIFWHQKVGCHNDGLPNSYKKDL